MGASVKLIKGKRSLQYCTHSDIESSEEDNENHENTINSTIPTALTDNEDTHFTGDVNIDENGAFEENDETTGDDADTVFEGDDSNSEGVSMTSSSEEAMLKCDGIILSQPLIAEGNCSSSDSEPRHNVIRYTVKEDGYYYMVFSSGDEKVTRFDQINQHLSQTTCHMQGRNPMMVKFDFLKTVYDVTDAKLVCTDATECNFPFRFASSQKIVVSLTASETQSDEVEENFIMESVCQPRTPLYLAFGLTLPILVVSFALI